MNNKHDTFYIQPEIIAKKLGIKLIQDTSKLRGNQTSLVKRVDGIFT